MREASQPNVIPSVPGYDEIVDRNQIEFLFTGGDLVIRNGDLALTRWGDLMLKNEDYSAYFKFVQQWRYNYPTQRVLFETIFDEKRKQNLEHDREEMIQRDVEESLRGASSALALALTQTDGTR